LTRRFGRLLFRPRACAAICACSLVLVFGCTFAPHEFNSRTRAASFDALWARLDSSYSYFEVREDHAAFRRAWRKRLIAADTPRLYLTEMARMLASLADPHLSFDNFEEYWQDKTELPLTRSAIAWAEAGRYWVAFHRDVVVPGSSPDAAPPADCYELLAVDGVRACPLAIDLLQGEPGRTIEARVLLAGGDEHTFKLRCPPPATATASRPSTAPADDAALGVTAYRAAGDIGVIQLKTLSPEAVVAAFDRALDALSDTRALVLDLRWNSGGSSRIVEAILGRFVSDTTPYARHVYRHRVSLIGGDVPVLFSFIFRAASRGRTYHKPVVCITDFNTASSAELLACGLHDARDAVLVGSRTIGAGAGVRSVRLPDGLSVQYSESPGIRLNGTAFQYVGIQPDIDVPLDLWRVRELGLAELRRWREEVMQAAIAEAARCTGSASE